MRILVCLIASVFIFMIATNSFAEDAQTAAQQQPTSATNSMQNTGPIPSSEKKNTDGKETINTEVPPFEITKFKDKGKDISSGGCIKDLSTEPVAAGDFGDHISFGPTVAAKAFNYDLASKKIAFNAGLGAGLSMRFYNTVGFKRSESSPAEKFGISEIRKRCRAETFDAAWLKSDNQMVIPLFSISPMVFASKSERVDEIQVQPAISVGFLGELVNVGAGFNLSGPDKGHVFLLLSIGYGFKF